jgi:PAS domain S-box-containing protein
MARLPDILDRIQGISLKWKLLVPFLFFAFTGTSFLVLIGFTSQRNLIRKEERSVMIHHYRHFLERLDQNATQASSIASAVAANPEVARLLAQRNRSALINLLEPSYVKLKDNFSVAQFHFHIQPGKSFLRLHSPEQFGDDIEPYRKNINNVLRNGETYSCLEMGATGLGIRGIVPVFYQEKIVGSLEIGLSFGEAFVEDFQKSWNINTSLFEIKGPEDYELIASAGDKEPSYPADIYGLKNSDDEPVIMISPDQFPNSSILLGPVKDCSGEVVALIEFNIDRSEIQDKLDDTRNIMVSVGIAGILISFSLTYLVIALFIKPIKEIVSEAQEIALEKREIQLDPRPNDEIGSLTNALNRMLESLKKRRVEIENYAKDLERRVQERTTDLLASEEKYRTLVENVPLVVYRVLRDGTTEFVNSYLTESLGYTIDDAVSDRRFWRDKISGEDMSAYNAINKRCFQEGEACRVESLVRAKDGRLLNFITHAIPAKDPDGQVRWVDGIMLDITELKRLQEREIQTEEIRTLGEISARMAHEIRNPLSAAGGFARRLSESLKNDDHNRKQADIIVGEVAKLENFVKILLSSIEPFDLSLSEVDFNEILISKIDELGPFPDLRGIQLNKNLEPDMPKIKADHEKLSRSFGNILKHAILSTPDGKAISISTALKDEHIEIIITHRVDRMSVDDMEKFFFPHIGQDMEKSVLDLPLSKIIIHRHGGKVDLIREEENILTMRIEFPIASDLESDQ